MSTDAPYGEHRVHRHPCPTGDDHTHPCNRPGCGEAGKAALNERLANRRKPGEDGYDPFYDASDDELAAKVSDALRTGPASEAKP